MKKLIWAWFIALAGVLFLSWLYQGEATSFHGIAEANETTVSMQNAVEVVQVYVIPGQEVHPGDTLAELSRPDLTLRINEITLELDAMQGRSGLNTAGIDQKVAEVQADLQSRRNTLQFEIEKLKTDYARNQEIASKLKSLPAGSVPLSSGNDAMSIRIKSLERELQMVEESSANQIRLLRGNRGLQSQSSKAEIEAKMRELELLKAEQKALTIVASNDWVVASVNARDGERVSAFEPIITLTRRTPTMVRGYIQEKVYNTIAVGDSVEVISSAASHGHVRGVVVGMGSRIVEFPVRLLKMPDLKLYGREVTIRIPEQNQFLLGEMTSIRAGANWNSIMPKEKK
jgi:multidrug resistance efflux pump